MKILGWLCIGLGLLMAVLPIFWVFAGIFIFLGGVFLIVAAINASSRRKRQDENVRVERVEFEKPRSGGVNNSMFGR